MRHDPRGLMIFAAGFGTRMGALTADQPKPLIPVAGRALIDHALEVAREGGADPVVVNLHYRAELLAAHLSARAVRLSWERDAILETGGGLRAALPLLGPGPVMTLNSDAVWTGPNPLVQLRAAWDPDRMDGLLLLAPVSALPDPGIRADFSVDPHGRIARHALTGGTGHAYLGAQIIRTEALAEIPDRVFSLNRLWDRMIAAGRAFGILHSGGWCDVGTPEAIGRAETLLREAGHV